MSAYGGETVYGDGDRHGGEPTPDRRPCSGAARPWPASSTARRSCPQAGSPAASDLIDGVERVASGGVASDTVVAYSSGAASADGQIYVASGGTMVGCRCQPRRLRLSVHRRAVGVGTILSGGDLALGGGTAIDTTIGSGGIETVSVVYVFSTGGYYPGVASATTIDGGTLALDGGVATGGILFTGSGPGLLEISGTVMPGATISGFTDTDAIDLQSLAYAGSDTVSLNSSTDVLTLTEGGSSLALQLAGSYAGTAFNLSPDTGSGSVIAISSSAAVIGTANVPCFAAGTRIATEGGEIVVEHLAIGDRLRTVGGDIKPITWIGSRRIDCRQHSAPAKVWPVLVVAHAFGPGAPRRDLWLSPDHAVFAEGVLIPVKHLVNGTTIRQIVIPAITYLHVGLDRHDVVLAEGLPVESYLDTGDRNAFESADGPTVLHPAFASERADIALFIEALGCAPLRVTGPEVAAVKARLADRAPRKAVLF